MNDLIDRQAAIDAVDIGNLHRGIVDALQNIISELPSAQSKPDENTLSEQQKFDKLGIKTGETCTDVISRQAAIHFKVSHGIDEDGVLYVPYGEVKKYLEQLPSAWPERKSFEWLPIDKEKLEAGKLIEDGTWCFFTNGESVSVERYKADIIGHFFPPGRFFSLDEAIAFIPIPEELFESAKHVGR